MAKISGLSVLLTLLFSLGHRASAQSNPIDYAPAVEQFLQLYKTESNTTRSVDYTALNPLLPHSSVHDFINNYEMIRKVFQEAGTRQEVNRRTYMWRFVTKSIDQMAELPALVALAQYMEEMKTRNDFSHESLLERVYATIENRLVAIDRSVKIVNTFDREMAEHIALQLNSLLLSSRSPVEDVVFEKIHLALAEKADLTHLSDRATTKITDWIQGRLINTTRVWIFRLAVVTVAAGSYSHFYDGNLMLTDIFAGSSLLVGGSWLALVAHNYFGGRYAVNLVAETVDRTLNRMVNFINKNKERLGPVSRTGLDHIQLLSCRQLFAK
ncbi:MAG: hypothetical protein K2Q26_08040 [Bdellovibrionales bacterium]|nr:hypothetical protein [Bdellovibrionales bacterium]